MRLEDVHCLQDNAEDKDTRQQGDGRQGEAGEVGFKRDGGGKTGHQDCQEQPNGDGLCVLYETAGVGCDSDSPPRVCLAGAIPRGFHAGRSI